MPRMKRCRRVGGLPGNSRFTPADTAFADETAVVMTVDEYETIRLIDYEGLNQEACAQRMQVGRTTVQQIYVDARRKLAAVLVEGRPLLISGGEYQLCQEDSCGNGCGRRRHGRGPGTPE